MPAWGPQVIPQVPDVPGPILPRASMEVPQLMAQQGAAGLAAFTNLAAQAAKAQTEREQLAQHGALAMQGFQLRREEQKQEYKMHTENMKNQADLVRLRADLEAKDRAEQTQQLMGYMTAKRNITFPLGTPERAFAEAALAGQFPRAYEDKWVREQLLAEEQNHTKAEALRTTSSMFTNPVLSAHIGDKGGVSFGVTEGKPVKDTGLIAPATKPVDVAVGDVKDGKFIGKVSGNTVRVDTGKVKTDGTPVYVLIPKDEYISRGGHLAPESMTPAATPSPAPTPSQTPAPSKGGAYAGGADKTFAGKRTKIIQVKTPEEALALEPGTLFLDPSGQLRTRQ